MDLDTAGRLAAELIALLEPACTKIRVAGSIRRRKPEVKDAEIVAVPRTRWVAQAQVGLFGAAPDAPVNRVEVSDLWPLVDELVAGPLELERHPPINGRAAPWGERYRKLAWKGLAVDLFTATPETLGAIALIRTGPAAFSQLWVTTIKQYGYAMKAGQVVDANGQAVPVRGEVDAFKLAGWTYQAPSERRA